MAHDDSDGWFDEDDCPFCGNAGCEECDRCESIGSCDECGTNLYEDDMYIHHGLELCGQCYWAMTH